MMSRFLVSVCLLCVSFVSLAARNDVLVIVNNNSRASVEVGEYYAAKRDVPSQNIVYLNSPANFFVSWDEFRSMRDQIIKHIQLNNLPANIAPAQCVEGAVGPYEDTKYYCANSINQIKDSSTIRYIVVTKGVPARVKVDGSELASKNAPATVDNYLRHWLVNYFVSDVSFSSDIRAAAFLDGSGMRLVDPSQDAELIIGRVDGLSTEAAKSLVDRAINAEQSGVFGKYHGTGQFTPNGIGSMHWKNFATNKSVYGTPASTGFFGVQNYGNSWRYQFGLLGETQPECVDYENNYLSFSASLATGKAPSSCMVKISEQLANEAIPGVSRSRIPLASDALVYIGNQDGQAIGAAGRDLKSVSFNNLLNWRRSTDACEALCTDDLCRQQSTDVLKEINTQCVGVSDGFIGYNLQSFPVAYMSAWPTDWHASNGGEKYRLAFPYIRKDIGVDDAFSVAFGNPDQVDVPVCYAGTSADGVTAPCYEDKILYFAQTIELSSIPQSGKQFTLRLNYRTQDLLSSQTAPTLQAKILPLSKRLSDNKSNYYEVTPATNLALLSNNQVDWVDAGDNTLVLSLDESQYELNSNKIYLLIKTNVAFSGQLGLDNIELIDNDTGLNLVANGSFDQGYKQVSGGDFASNYLSRLNGTAFWGSASHHESGGHSFDTHIMETFIYFFRGLPLGDAVWFAETYNSGFLFGDPLYSPLATWLKVNSNHPDGFVDVGSLPLSGDALNGTASQVSSSYQIDYCFGDDFYECDKSGSWQSTGLSGIGGARDLSFGSWEPTGSPDRKYVLRLAVSTNNTLNGKSQTFYDYRPVQVVFSATDYDGDGVSNDQEIALSSNLYNADSDGDGLDDAQEVALGTNLNAADTDSDGLTDSEEVNTYSTNPLSSDTDGDGLNDNREIQLGTDPANPDTDGDGFGDAEEVAIGMDPLVADAQANPWIGTVSGRVTTADGKGVAGITFWDALRYPQTVTTDENGYYVIRGYQQGDYVFLIASGVKGYTLSKAGWSEQSFVHDGGAAAAYNYIAVQDAGTVSGKVVMDNGDALGGITFWMAHRYPETLDTVSDGSFIDYNYVVDEWVWPILSGVDGYSITPVGWNGFGFQHDGTAMQGYEYVAAPKADTVSGRIRTPDGKPVAGLELWDAIKYPASKQKTRSDGGFIFTGYSVGDYVYPITAPTSEYRLVKAGWSGSSFQYNGSAIRHIDYVAVPR